MARALGKSRESDRWLDDAEAIRSTLLKRLYVSNDAAFYDLDAHNQFVRVRSDVISRVVGEHVVDQKTFNTIYEKQLHNPKSFWAAYPLPSIALDDPSFVRPITGNSWGGPSQALTALRTPRWMEHYGKPADLAYLMTQWTRATAREGKFLQQMDPVNGAFTADKGDYSPAALVFIDFTWRLSGVRHVGDTLEWNINPGDAGARFRLKARSTLTAEIQYSPGGAQLLINDKLFCRTNDRVRLTTDLEGKLQRVTGIAEKKTNAQLDLSSGKTVRFSVEPNETRTLSRI
jgi:hypothetical protein